MLKRKIDSFLEDWKNNPNKKPLIVSGARQIGKTTSIGEFGKTYESYIEINFFLEPKYKAIFNSGYEVNEIIKELSLLNPNFKIIPNNTLILFDEIQSYPDAITSLKSFALDKRFDIICSGSLLGVHYKHITSVPVGFKEEYIMKAMDFEEFLWANGYRNEHIEELFCSMKKLKPLSENIMNTFSKLFEDYLFCGGYPEAVDIFVKEKNFSNVFPIHKRIHKDYEDDITKYVEGLDTARVLNLYRHITPQLSKENHKFQYTKLGHGARFRDYIGCEEWLSNAGIINLAYKLKSLEFPFKGNEDTDLYKIYYSDTSLLISTLDDEANEDVRINKNFGIYNGAIYENIVGCSLLNQGYDLYYYRNTDSTIELDFLIRVKNEIIPIEVKTNKGKMKSINNILKSNQKINYAIKLSKNNIGFVDNKFTFPYFLTFLLKRFFKETDYISW